MYLTDRENLLLKTIGNFKKSPNLQELASVYEKSPQSPYQFTTGVGLRFSATLLEDLEQLQRLGYLEYNLVEARITHQGIYRLKELS